MYLVMRHRHSAIGAAVAAAALTAAACGPERPLEPLPALTLEPLPSPTAAEGASVRLTAAGDTALLTWMEGTGGATTLRLAARTAAGWSDPVDVVAGAQLIVNAADVPSALPLADGRVAASWIEANGADPEAYDLRLAWSADGGRSWTPPVTPHDDGLRAQHGFASLFEPPGGGTGLVWIDGRNAVGGLIGDMALRAAVYDQSGVQRGQQVVDTRVCECCQTDAAVSADGVIVAYRDRSPDEVRDIYVTRLDGAAWAAPVRVHEDGWRIHGCPVNGPAVSALGRDVAVVWYSAPKDAGHAFAAFSGDGGRSFGRPVQLDDAGSGGRVQVELIGGGVAAATWIELEGGSPVFKIRRVDAEGRRSDATAIAPASGRQYLRLARRNDELLLAWLERIDGSVRVQTARARF
jgi:hypothetical protein